MHLFRVMATDSVSGKRVPSQLIRCCYSSCSYIFSIFSLSTPALCPVQTHSFLLSLSEIGAGPAYVRVTACTQQGLCAEQGEEH